MEGESSEDKPRPLTSRAEIVPLLLLVLPFPAIDTDGARPSPRPGGVVEEAGEYLPFWPGLPAPPPALTLPLPFPLPPVEPRISRIARAPKLMRRANGVPG